ncbi:DeoR/GlpR family DNA-binding transcription regulator [Ferrimonas gelatinilytica]|uniref:DeoR/GlpR family DNA-binding transcription regulator n=1 Tax=Ferrimonas gelatinilytica TaxID=1255257 RepID=A0ABP9SFR3_9GAMM
MIPAERQRIILKMLEAQEICTINELTEKLAVSHMTVRRDIAKLEAKGRVFSVAGGVQRTEAIREELTHNTKKSQNIEVKRALGRAVAEMIPERSTVYLDAGSTMMEVARQLVDRADILLVTNDFFISSFLAEHGRCEIYHTGGKVERSNNSCVGEQAKAFLRQVNIDVAFIATACWDSRGISSPSEDKVVVKQKVAEVSKEVILVCDSSKFGKTGTFLALANDAFDRVVTDDGLPQPFADQLATQEIEVIRVAR